MTTARLQIERMTIELSGLSEADGRALAKLIAKGLASASMPTTEQKIPGLRVRIPAGRNSDLPDLAQRIVTATLGALQRSG
jgi:hypothetical protein